MTAGEQNGFISRVLARLDQASRDIARIARLLLKSGVTATFGSCDRKKEEHCTDGPIVKPPEGRQADG